MQPLIKQLEELLASITAAMEKLKLASDEAEISQLEAQAAEAGFWDDPAKAATHSQKLAALKNRVEQWQNLQGSVADSLELAKTGDDSLMTEIERSYANYETDFKKRELELKLGGHYDKQDAIVSVHAGTGGTDAQDWAQMLLRMYLRWCEKTGMTATVLEQSLGEEAGIKSATIEISGTYAYGKLRSERGVHRLVRLSPYNSDNLRQTSFALVDVIPQIDQADEVEIEPKDLRIDVYRAGGHGGQSVNTTDSAVRITHLPTGTVVAIQNERSQLKNKEKAMKILRAKLADLMHTQHKAKITEIRGQTQSAAWGNQIRSYVLHPYQMVKDHRTGVETSQTTAVLDGQIDMFIEAYLNSHIGEN